MTKEQLIEQKQKLENQKAQRQLIYDAERWRAHEQFMADMNAFKGAIEQLEQMIQEAGNGD